jgi:hypothetical protein
MGANYRRSDHMQRGDIVNVLPGHDAEPRLAIVTGSAAEGLVDLWVVPEHRNDHLSVLRDVVAVASEQDARVEGAGEHGQFVVYPLGADAPAVDDVPADVPTEAPAPAKKTAAAAKR